MQILAKSQVGVRGSLAFFTYGSCNFCFRIGYFIIVPFTLDVHVTCKLAKHSAKKNSILCSLKMCVLYAYRFWFLLKYNIIIIYFCECDINLD